MKRLPQDVPDPRGVHGCWHPWRSVLGILALAKLCGIQMGRRQIASFADGLTQPPRRALRCRRDPAQEGRYAVPAESTYQRALTSFDPAVRFEPLLLEWQHAQLGRETGTKCWYTTAHRAGERSKGCSSNHSLEFRILTV